MKESITTATTPGVLASMEKGFKYHGAVFLPANANQRESQTMGYHYMDTSKRDGFYVQLEREIVEDTDTKPEDPSFDFNENDLEEFRSGSRSFVGVLAVANCLIVCGGTGILVTIKTPGVWGVDGDEAHCQERYLEQVAELKAMLAAMRDPIYED